MKMTVREDVPLATLTTLRVGGPARYVIDIHTKSELAEAIAFARERTLPYAVLGEGSNVLAHDAGYEGVIFRMRIPGVSFVEDENVTTLEAGAGVIWDELVEAAATRGLWGIENLAGIPGTVGAAPVQNIGAYGMELERALESVVCMDASDGTIHTLPRDECGFSYRDSRFKREPNLIIIAVTLRLGNENMPQVGYSDLARLAEGGIPLDTPKRIGDAVRQVRTRKFPDLAVYGSAGSFFKNPIITKEKYAELSERFREVIAQHGAIPQYPLGQTGEIKIPLAYVLDKVLGLRGYGNARAHLFENQPLVLVADSEARASDVDTLANEVARKVFDATGITIEREVRNIPSE
ncbi:MAG: UDP-N-acetylmuramate dehydrogenase [Patescibacteria group bacterium]